MQNGFTLLELLVSVTVVGILASIAVPQYKIYKAKAYDSVAVSDLHSVVLAEESYFIENNAYLSCKDADCASLPGISNLSKGVHLEVDATESAYVITASHKNGSGKTYRWDSEHGGLD